MLVDAPCSELAAALDFQEKKAVDLQDTLQRVLDRREEERQSKELLQLYLKATEKEERPQEEPSQSSQGGMAVSLCGNGYPKYRSGTFHSFLTGCIVYTMVFLHKVVSLWLESYGFCCFPCIVQLKNIRNFTKNVFFHRDF